MLYACREWSCLIITNVLGVLDSLDSFLAQGDAVKDIYSVTNILSIPPLNFMSRVVSGQRPVNDVQPLPTVYLPQEYQRATHIVLPTLSVCPPVEPQEDSRQDTLCTSAATLSNPDPFRSIPSCICQISTKTGLCLSTDQEWTNYHNGRRKQRREVPCCGSMCTSPYLSRSPTQHIGDDGVCEFAGLGCLVTVF